MGKGYEVMDHEPNEQRPTRVLVADDDQSIRQLVCTIVKREGVEVDSAGDGLAAIERIKEHPYAVILLDLMMPNLDGFGVIEYLRQNPPAVKPVILVMTAYTDQKFKDVDPEVVAGVLRKPFEIAELAGIVRLCMSGFAQDVAKRLIVSSDRAVRDFTMLKAKENKSGTEN